MSESTITLTLEQQFELRAFKERVQSLSREEAHNFLVELYELMIKKETMYKQFLKEGWGVY